MMETAPVVLRRTVRSMLAWADKGRGCGWPDHFAARSPTRGATISSCTEPMHHRRAIWSWIGSGNRREGSFNAVDARDVGSGLGTAARGLHHRGAAKAASAPRIRPPAAAPATRLRSPARLRPRSPALGTDGLSLGRFANCHGAGDLCRRTCSSAVTHHGPVHQVDRNRLRSDSMARNDSAWTGS